jgi:hypothetical protein
MYKRSSKHILYIVWLSAAILISLSIDADAQTKLIKRNGWYRNAPIEVFDLKAKNQSVNFNEAFEADTDWLKDVSLKIKNNSEKTIVCIYMAVIFRETAPAPMMYPKHFGRPTNTSVKAKGQPLELKPGEVLTVSLADEFEGLKRAVEQRRPVDSVNIVELEITRAHFEDGMMWDLGELYRPDPGNLGKWILVERGVWIPPV